MERRTGVTLPAGTAYSFDMQVLMALLSGNNKYDKAEGDMIAGITIEGVKHEFSLIELEMLPNEFCASLRQNPDLQPGHAALTLILEMYLHRYPYTGLSTPCDE